MERNVLTMTATPIGAVDAIWRYPVSSAGGERVPRAYAVQAGLSGDRSYAVFDDETLEPADPAKREWHAVPRLLARLGKGGQLEMSVDSRQWLSHDDPQFREALCELYQRQVCVRPYGANVSGKVLAHRYKLSPIHLLSRQSLAKLQSLIPESLVDVRRFRPNIVVDLPNSQRNAPPEYQLIGQEFQLGSLRLRGVKPCGRCSFTTLKQFDIPEDRSVLRALISHFDKDFGIYCDVVEDGWVEQGDSVVLDQAASYRSPVVVIGGGQAGATAARMLREYGHTGPITILGEEGHAPYERPPLSKTFVLPAPGTPPLTHVLSFTDADQLGIELRLSERAVHIDRQTKVVETAHGASYPYGHLVIATGGSARRMPMVSRGYGRTHSIRTVLDAEHLQRAFEGAQKVFVLGGGWLGLEIASAARKISIDVELFARQARLCSRVLPEAVADYIAQEHIRHGVKLHLGCEPVFHEYPDRIEAHFDGAVETADLLIVAIGMAANDHLAKHAGLDCEDGVLTDEDGATSDPDVFAVGDVSRQRSAQCLRGMRIESWQNATEQAGRAAMAILGLERPPPYVQRFWSDQYDLSIQVAGSPDPGARPVSCDSTTAPFWQFETFAVGINRPMDVHRFAARLAGGEAQRPLDVDSRPSDTAPRQTVRQLIGSIGDISSGDLKQVTVVGIGQIVIARVGDGYFGIQEQCPHASASLAEGFLENGRIVCPLHFAEFDLVTGAAFNAPKGCARAVTYRIEADGEMAYIWVPLD
ncbi:FAD-dependent oxidoreductase [Pseudomonas sp. JDS28PS106]|uniref:FAD-dependent oxidoreductase n=1 Tax=Pseudomonas sp. JDS28PS106 TaxID=2497235 RepID=UPI002FD20D93